MRITGRRWLQVATFLLVGMTAGNIFQWVSFLRTRNCFSQQDVSQLFLVTGLLQDAIQSHLYLHEGCEPRWQWPMYSKPLNHGSTLFRWQVDALEWSPALLVCERSRCLSSMRGSQWGNCQSDLLTYMGWKCRWSIHASKLAQYVTCCVRPHISFISFLISSHFSCSALYLKIFEPTS